MGNYTTNDGIVRITPESVSVPKKMFGLRCPLTDRIDAGDIAFITVGSLDRQYVTGKRAAGVVLTGGLALLAPSRKRSNIIIALNDGTVTEYVLKGKWAKRSDLIRAEAAACGYRTVPIERVERITTGPLPTEENW